MLTWLAATTLRWSTPIRLTARRILTKRFCRRSSEREEEVEALWATHRHHGRAAAIADPATRTGDEVWATPLPAKCPSPPIAYLFSGLLLQRGGMHRDVQIDREVEDRQIAAARRSVANGQSAMQAHTGLTLGRLKNRMCFALEDERGWLTGQAST